MSDERIFPWPPDSEKYERKVCGTEEAWIPKVDPTIDNVVVRLNRNVHEMDNLIRRAGGLLFGAMDYEKAFEYLSEAERLTAEVRTAVQIAVEREREEG